MQFQQISLAGRSSFGLLLAAASLTLAPTASSQVTLRTYNGTQVDAHFGSSVTALGDVNGDGVADYAIGAAGHNQPQVVRVYSGSTGGELYTLPFGGGSRIFNLGDIDGDGITDFSSVYWDYDPCFCYQEATIYSGVNGAEIWSVSAEIQNAGSVLDIFGSAMCGVQDVNGDGVRDVAIVNGQQRNPVTNSKGKLFLFSGANGQLLWSLEGDATPEFQGFDQLTPLADIDGDGIEDLAIDINVFEQNNPIGGIRVLSGATGATISSTLGSLDRSIRTFVPLGSDFDGDGTLDYVVAGRLPGSVDYMAIVSLSDITTSLIEATGLFGRPIRCGQDLTGDGVPDVVSSALQVWSGVDLHLVFSVPGFSNAADRTAVIGDVNQDGQADILFGTHRNSSYVGMARVISGGLRLGTEYCHSATPNSTGRVALIHATGSNLVSQDWLNLQVTDLPPYQMAFFIASMDSGFIANPGGSMGHLCLSGPIGRFNTANQIQVSDANGFMGLQIDMGSIPQPNNTVPIQFGQQWNFQLWYRDTGGTANFTTAVSIDWN